MKSETIFFNARNLQFLALFLVFLGCLFLSDEGRKPLIYNGSELKSEPTENAITFYTPKFLFNKGSYNINIALNDVSETLPKIELWRQSEKLTEWQIAQNSDNFSSDFTLPYDSQDVQFRVVFDSEENSNITKLTISPKTFFYSDTYFMIALFLLAAIFAQLYFAKNKNKISQNQIIDLYLILGIAVLCTFPFFGTTNIYDKVDIGYHLTRIEGIKDGILDGQMGAYILPQGAENYGYLNALYPYSFLYIPALLRLCKVSLLFSYKFFILLINLATALSVYKASKTITKSRLNIFLAMILYVFMPFRLNNLFVRSALGEVLAIIFWPMVIAGLYNTVFGDKRKWYYLAIGISGMIQSHILSAMLSVIFCILAAFLFIKQILQSKAYLQIIKVIFITALLNIFFIIPFLYYYTKADINCSLEILDITNYFEMSINPSNFLLTFIANSDFDFRYLNCSNRQSSHSYMNRPVVTVYSYIFSYLVSPKRVGELPLPVVTVNVGGQIYRSKSIRMNVLERNDKIASAGIQFTMSKEEVSVGEPVEMLIALTLYDDNSVRNLEVPFLNELSDFFEFSGYDGDFKRSRRERDAQGRVLTQYVSKVTAFPKAPGEYVFSGPMVTLIEPDASGQQNNLFAFFLSALGTAFLIYYVFRASTDVISSDYIRIVDYYLDNVRDIHYLTLFKRSGNPVNLLENIKESIEEFAELISIDVNKPEDKEKKLEIWVRTPYNDAELLYFFPYDSGVVEL